MPQYRISQVAALAQVSDDTVRRWVDTGRLVAGEDEAGRLSVDGMALAEFLSASAASTQSPLPAGAKVVGESARNRLPGLVTRVVRDGVMAQVEMQVGPHRVVSLMSREAADELNLAPGSLAVAAVKSTNVVIEALELP
ncbi:MAG: TOBE domain-containing protein [Candidatus Nanopelagicales bacterium]